MKTNFLQKNSASNRRKKSALRPVIIGAGILIAAAVVFFVFAGVFRDSFAPVWQARSAAAGDMQIFFGFFRSKTSLIYENERLMQEVADEQEQILSVSAAASSRGDLLAAFGRSSATGTPATVLVRPPETPYDMLTIDAGKNLGVEVGAVVATPAGLPLGLISSVSARTAEVALFSSPGTITEAVLERGDVPVKLVGRGGGDFEFNLPRETPVEVGDRILTANLDASLLAVVGETTIAPTDAEATVLAESPVNLETLRDVIVLK